MVVGEGRQRVSPWHAHLPHRARDRARVVVAASPNAVTRKRLADEEVLKVLRQVSAEACPTKGADYHPQYCEVCNSDPFFPMTETIAALALEVADNRGLKP